MGYPQPMRGAGPGSIGRLPMTSQGEFGLARESRQGLGAGIEGAAGVDGFARAQPDLGPAKGAVGDHGDQPPAIRELLEQPLRNLRHGAFEHDGAKWSMRRRAGLQCALQHNGVDNMQLA